MSGYPDCLAATRAQCVLFEFPVTTEMVSETNLSPALPAVRRGEISRRRLPRWQRRSWGGQPGKQVSEFFPRPETDLCSMDAHPAKLFSQTAREHLMRPLSPGVRAAREGRRRMRRGRPSFARKLPSPSLTKSAAPESSVGAFALGIDIFGAGGFRD